MPRASRTLPSSASLDASDIRVEDVYVEHFAYVYRSLLRLGIARRDAEDLAQDVFVVVHRRLATYDPARPIKPWLFGIAYNVMRDHQRRASVQRESLEPQEEPDASDPRFRAVEASDIVHLALARIPEARRVVFVLFEMDQWSMKEIATFLQIEIDTGYSRLRKARDEFRQAVHRLEGEP